MPKDWRIGLCLLFILALLPLEQTTGGNGAHGVLAGRVTDQASGLPLPGATVRLEDSGRATAADSTGRFAFEGLPQGTYNLTVRFLGYLEVTRHEVRLVTDTSRVEIVLALVAQPVPANPIVVRGARDPRSDRAGTGTVVVTGESIAERPGSLNDISRTVSAMVPVARFDDRYPSLIVRGGSAIENGFYVDNIPIPTINHFPSQGSGSGPLGILNANLIDDARFYAGGFPLSFGDRLSSIFDISFRDGNRKDFSGVATLDVTGASLLANGPLFGGRGSYLVAGRQGFLNVLLDMLDIDASPAYTDGHAKGTLDLDSLTRMSLIALAGRGHFHLSDLVSEDGGADFYGNLAYRTVTAGINIDRRRDGVGRWQTSLSGSHIKRNDDHYFTRTEHRVYENSSIDETVSLRHVGRQIVAGEWTALYGAEGHYRNADYHFLINPFNDEGGYMSDTVVVNATERYVDAAAWLAAEWQATDRLRLTIGARYDRWGFTGKESVSPRGSLEYAISERTFAHAALGRYTQSLPLSILLQHDENFDLPVPRSLHAVVGFTHFAGESIRLGVEGYIKAYERMPMDSSRPTVFVLDELVYDYGFLPGHVPLEASGEAGVRGVEVSVDVTLARRLLIGLSGAVSRAWYDDYNGVRRPRVIDNTAAMDCEARYRPGAGWQLSARWVYGGGRPYTPYDTLLTKAYNAAIYDYDRANEVRYAAYHSLNMRLQREVAFSGSRLMIYGEVWNVYDRENVAGHYWDEGDRRFEMVKQFPLIPVLGVEYRF